MLDLSRNYASICGADDGAMYYQDGNRYRVDGTLIEPVTDTPAADAPEQEPPALKVSSAAAAKRKKPDAPEAEQL